MTWIIPDTRKNGQRGHGVRAKPYGVRTMPKQKPGLSEQTVGTPWEFIDAVEERFGPLTIDLASDETNAKAPMWIPEEANTFTYKWARTYEGNMWLNPEFGDIRPYAKKCAKESRKLRPGSRIFLLTPASIGSHWFGDYVHDKALVLSLFPRIKFVGHKHQFPKDLILSVYGEEPGFELWTWKETRKRNHDPRSRR